MKKATIFFIVLLCIFAVSCNRKQDVNSSTSFPNISLSTIDLGREYSIFPKNSFSEGFLVKWNDIQKGPYYYYENKKMTQKNFKQCSGEFDFEGRKIPFSFHYAFSPKSILTVYDRITSSIQFQLIKIPNENNSAVFYIQRINAETPDKEDINMADCWIINLSTGELSPLVDRSASSSFYEKTGETSRYDFASTPIFSSDGQNFFFKTNRDYFPEQKYDLYIYDMKSGEEWIVKLPDRAAYLFNAVNIDCRWISNDVIAIESRDENNTESWFEIYNVDTKSFTQSKKVSYMSGRAVSVSNSVYYISQDGNKMENLLTGDKKDINLDIFPSVFPEVNNSYGNKILHFDLNIDTSDRKIQIYDVQNNSKLTLTANDLNCQEINECHFYDENILLVAVDDTKSEIDLNEKYRYIFIILNDN